MTTTYGFKDYMSPRPFTRPNPADLGPVPAIPDPPSPHTFSTVETLDLPIRQPVAATEQDPTPFAAAPSRGWFSRLLRRVR
jgi:hypothetical protein